MANAIVVKQEPTDRVEIENRLFRLCDENPRGLQIPAAQAEITNCSLDLLMKIINGLLSSKKLGFVEQSNGQRLLVRPPPVGSTPTVKKTGLSDHDEKLVYQTVAAAGNKGVWEKDVRFKTKLHTTTCNKILKSLESKKLIKSVKSVAANRKKMYMLYELEPDVSVTGGTWYSDQSFDSEFVQLVTELCIKCVQQKAESADLLHVVGAGPLALRAASFVTSDAILDYITDTKCINVKLSTADVDAVMNSLVYARKVERDVTMTTDMDGASVQINSYRAIAPSIPPTGLMRMPCGFCPVVSECHEGGIISPSSCRYMQEWLDHRMDF